jgi:hypothetical protein
VTDLGRFVPDHRRNLGYSVRIVPQSTNNATHSGHLPEERCKIADFWMKYVSGGSQTAPDHRGNAPSICRFVMRTSRNPPAVDRIVLPSVRNVPYLTRNVPYLTRSVHPVLLFGLILALREVHEQLDGVRGPVFALPSSGISESERVSPRASAVGRLPEKV